MKRAYGYNFQIKLPVITTEVSNFGVQVDHPVGQLRNSSNLYFQRIESTQTILSIFKIEKRNVLRCTKKYILILIFHCRPKVRKRHPNICFRRLQEMQVRRQPVLQNKILLVDDKQQKRCLARDQGNLTFWRSGRIHLLFSLR